MLSTLALVTLMMVPLGQADGLTLSGVRLTHGVLGPARADNKLLPGDHLIIKIGRAHV